MIESASSAPSKARLYEIAAIFTFLVPPILIVLRVGDPLYLSIFYYFIVSVLVIGAVALARPRPYLLAGIALALSLTLLAYQWVQLALYAQRPEGLLGIGHAFSSLGALLAGIIIAIASRRHQWKNPLYLFGFGLIATLIGFLIAQIFLCNTEMYCGHLTWRRL